MSDSGALGLVLAGGASRRMGRDKASLRLADGTTFLEHAIRRLQSIGLEVLVAGGRAVDSVPEGVTRVGDAWPPEAPGGSADVSATSSAASSAALATPHGPIAGLLGAARARPGRALLALAVDLPLVPAALLESLLARPGEWVVPAHPSPGGSRLQPTCALYRPPALAALSRRAAAGDRSLRGLRDEPGLDVEIVRDLGDSEAFANVNTPDDLRRLAGTAPSSSAFATLRRRSAGR